MSQDSSDFMSLMDHVETVISDALTEALPHYESRLEAGRFEHRGPFFFAGGVYFEEQHVQAYWTKSVGSVEDVEAPVKLIAESKHEISRREQKPTVEVPLHERQVGDTQFWGSIIIKFKGGYIVMAISGLQPWFDEMLSGIIGYIVMGELKDAEIITRGPEPDRSQSPILDHDRLQQLKDEHTEAEMESILTRRAHFEHEMAKPL